MNAHDTPSGTRMMCDGERERHLRPAHGTGSTASTQPQRARHDVAYTTLTLPSVVACQPFTAGALAAAFMCSATVA